MIKVTKTDCQAIQGMLQKLGIFILKVPLQKQNITFKLCVTQMDRQLESENLMDC